MDLKKGREEIAAHMGITVAELRAMQEDENNDSFMTNDKETRIVLVGKTGNGKSLTGNVILGGNYFASKFSAKSFTVNCSKAKAVVDGIPVAIIDTPGLFDTRFGMGQTTKDLSQCIKFASPGPHVFLVVVRLGRFTAEEQQTVQKIQEIFGPAADKYSMVLFTHADQLEGSFEDFLNESPEIQELVKRCNGEYQVFNNKSNDHSQVTQLLQKIHRIVAKNGGRHYTNKMFQEAEKAIEEAKKRILAEKAEKIRREREKIEQAMQAKFQQEMQRMEANMRAEQQREKQRMEQMMKMERDKFEKEREHARQQKEMDMKRFEEEKQKLLERVAKETEEKKKELEKQVEEAARKQAENEDCCSIA